MPIKDPEKRRAYYREWFKRQYRTNPKHKQMRLAASEKQRQKDAAKAKAILVEAQKGGCILCFEAEPLCLTMHHLDPAAKDIDISRAANSRPTIKKLIAELSKCVCLCANCHRKVHAGSVVLWRV